MNRHKKNWLTFGLTNSFFFLMENYMFKTLSFWILSVSFGVCIACSPGQSYENKNSSAAKLQQKSNSENQLMTHKIIPEEIRPQAEKALSFYPELKDVPITFKFKKNIKKSTMQAQPKISGIFKKKHKREYVILISERIQIEDDSFNILDIDDEIMIGWLGHELGHIMDYQHRTGVGMIIFGLKYLYSSRYIREVERAADTYAIQHGMVDYIVATKNFILNNADISETYKERIRRLYLSPEEIMELVNKMDKEELEDKVDEEMEEQEAE